MAVVSSVRLRAKHRSPFRTWSFRALVEQYNAYIIVPGLYYAYQVLSFAVGCVPKGVPLSVSPSPSTAPVHVPVLGDSRPGVCARIVCVPNGARVLLRLQLRTAFCGTGKEPRVKGCSLSQSGTCAVLNVAVELRFS